MAVGCRLLWTQARAKIWVVRARQGRSVSEARRGLTGVGVGGPTGAKDRVDLGQDLSSVEVPAEAGTRLRNLLEPEGTARPAAAATRLGSSQPPESIRRLATFVARKPAGMMDPGLAHQG
jgi:hypothetical protein